MNNTLNRRQFMLLSIILLVTYKLSLLPAMLTEYMHNSVALMGLIYMVVEGAILIMVYFIVDRGYLQALKTKGTKWLYTLIMLSLLIFCMFKASIYLSEGMGFISSFLFPKSNILVISLAIIVPIILFAKYGINNIGRTTEVLIWLIIAVLVFNILFLKTDSNYYRNLPLLSYGPKVFLGNGAKFMLWLGDSIPLLFVENISEQGLRKDNESYSFPMPDGEMKKLSKHKHRKLWASIVFSMILVVYMYILATAIYGSTLENVSNFVVRLGTYNDFSKELGRLDWTGIIAWIIMSILCLSLYVTAASKGVCEMICTYRNKISQDRHKEMVLMLLISSLVIIVELYFANNKLDSKEKLIAFATNWRSYYAIIVAIFVPILVLIVGKIKEKHEQDTQK